MTSCSGQFAEATYNLDGDIEGCILLTADIQDVYSTTTYMSDGTSTIFVIDFVTSDDITYLALSVSARYNGGDPVFLGSTDSVILNSGLQVVSNPPDTFNTYGIVYSSGSFTYNTDGFILYKASSTNYSLYVPATVGVSLTSQVKIDVTNNVIA